MANTNLKSQIDELMNTFVIGYWRLDAASKEVFWSENIHKIHEVSIDYQPELVAALNFFSEEEPGRKAITSVINKALTNAESWDLECKLVTAKQRNIWVRATGKAVVDDLGKVIALEGFFQDVSPYMIALEASQIYKRDLEYQQYALNRHAIVSIADTQGNIVYANQKFVDVSGYYYSELLNNNHRLLNSGVHDKEFWVIFWETISSGCDYRVEICNRRKNGELYWVDSSVLPHFNEKGEIDRYISIRTDITEAKLQQEQQLELEKALQQAKKMEVVGQLVGGIAHDFNNLLAVIVGYSDLLQRLLVDKGDLVANKYIDSVVRSGNRAKDLVARLLTFSSGNTEATERVSLSLALDEFQSFVRPVLPSSIRLEIKIESELFVLFNETSLSQILMNLAVNARDAMHEEGVLAISVTQAVAINNQCNSCLSRFSGSYVLLEVSDTGMGIDPLIMKYLFDPFFSTKEIGEGSGIGLSMVHGLIHSAKGHVVINSEMGVGTSIQIYLPLLAANPVIIDNKYSDVIAHLPAKIVFIIDDEREIAEILAEYLSETELDVRIYDTTDRLLDDLISKNISCDLLITDMTMPCFSGRDITIMLKQRGYTMPVIAISGHNEIVNEYNFQQSGFSAYLKKPIVRNDFIRAISDALNVL